MRWHDWYYIRFESVHKVTNAKIWSWRVINRKPFETVANMVNNIVIELDSHGLKDIDLNQIHRI